MAEYKVKDIQQRISEALRQLRDGDRPIITSNGQPIAFIGTLSDLEKLTMLTAFEPPAPPPDPEREIATRALQLSGGEFDRAMALLSRAAVALFAEKERQRRVIKQAAKDDTP